MITLKEIMIGKIQTNINVVMQLDKSTHAGERQDRHGTGRIDDEDIKSTINLGLPKIANALLFDKIDIGNSVLVANQKTHLNVVGNLQRGGNNMIDFVVITVMKKPNFKPKGGTHLIKV